MSHHKFGVIDSTTASLRRDDIRLVSANTQARVVSRISPANHSVDVSDHRNRESDAVDGCTTTCCATLSEVICAFSQILLFSPLGRATTASALK